MEIIRLSVLFFYKRLHPWKLHWKLDGIRASRTDAMFKVCLWMDESLKAVVGQLGLMA